MYPRTLHAKISESFFKGKVIMVLGPRQVGKTTLVDAILRQDYSKRTVERLNGDLATHRDRLDSRNADALADAVAGIDIFFIDEAQKVPSIGETLKVLVDRFGPSKQIIITGSSSVHLLSHTSEPLTGRKRVFELFPLSYTEMFPAPHAAHGQDRLESLLRFGTYPAVLAAFAEADKRAELQDLASGAAYRDILEFQQLKNPQFVGKLLKALALQIGSQVSLNELGKLVGLDSRTVERYVDLLEKSYVVFRLPPYSSNPRKEIAKMHKVFFYDLGIRNAVLDAFQPMENRADAGALFENFCVVERLKKLKYAQSGAQQYFWRDRQGHEMDLVEEGSGKLTAFECKLSDRKAARGSQYFLGAYPHATAATVSPAKLGAWLA